MPIQASMDHDRQLERYSISDVEPMEQLTEPCLALILQSVIWLAFIQNVDQNVDKDMCSAFLLGFFRMCNIHLSQDCNFQSKFCIFSADFYLV